MNRILQRSFPRINLFVLCVCLFFFSGCFSKNNKEDSGSVKLSQFRVSLKIPENFQSVPREQFKDFEALGSTLVEVEPFTVLPHYAYADRDGKGILIISELKFSENSVPQKYPVDNIYIYKKNLETFFAAGEIANEEIAGKDISTVLLAMMFNEGEDAVFLFKGLSYKYPDCFFMLDLYVLNAKVTTDDAAGFQNIFYSMGIY